MGEIIEGAEVQHISRLLRTDLLDIVGEDDELDAADAASVVEGDGEEAYPVTSVPERAVSVSLRQQVVNELELEERGVDVYSRVLSNDIYLGQLRIISSWGAPYLNLVCARHQRSTCRWMMLATEKYDEKYAACLRWLEEGLRTTEADHMESAKGLRRGFGLRVR